MLLRACPLALMLLMASAHVLFAQKSDSPVIKATDGKSQTAEPAEPPEPFLSKDFWPGFLGALLYGPLGIVLAVLGFKVFDWITPKMDIQKELTEKANIAVAIVSAAIILGVCYIVASVVK